MLLSMREVVESRGMNIQGAERNHNQASLLGLVCSIIPINPRIDWVGITERASGIEIPRTMLERLMRVPSGTMDPRALAISEQSALIEARKKSPERISRLQDMGTLLTDWAHTSPDFNQRLVRTVDSFSVQGIDNQPVTDPEFQGVPNSKLWELMKLLQMSEGTSDKTGIFYRHPAMRIELAALKAEADQIKGTGQAILKPGSTRDFQRWYHRFSQFHQSDNPSYMAACLGITPNPLSFV